MVVHIRRPSSASDHFYLPFLDQLTEGALNRSYMKVGTYHGNFFLIQTPDLVFEDILDPLGRGHFLRRYVFDPLREIPIGA